MSFGFYDINWLIKDPEISHCINACIDNNGKTNYKEFWYHWDNYELTYQHGFCPTEKQIDLLVDKVKVTKLPKNYHDPWWPKIKGMIDDSLGMQKIWGQQVDRFTASMMKNVVDALNPTNKAKLIAMDFPIAHHICMSYYSDKRAGKV